MIACGDEIVNTSSNPFDEKRSHKTFFLSTILLVMSLLLLTIIDINCYCIKHRSKNKNKTLSSY